MIGLRCVLIFCLILSTTLVSGHSINRRDNQNNDESDDDKMKMLKSISEMLKMSAQKMKGSFIMGYHHLVGTRIAPDDTNSTSEDASRETGSMDDDTIVFKSDDGPDVTAAIMTTMEENQEKQHGDAPTIPTILNRSLLDTPIACGGGQQLGKDGKCRVVW